MAGRKERQKELARQRLARRAARSAERDRRTRQITISVCAAVAVIAVIVGAVILASQGSGKKAAASTPAAAPSVTPTASPAPSASPSAAVPVVAEPAHHCTYKANPPASRKVSFPSAKPDYQAAYTATIKTNRGSIAIDLLNSKATCTVNSFVHLALRKYFNNTHCHRLTTAGGLFVLQCGDPTGTGEGGPGYEFASENLTGATYPAGTVAMANTGQPDSNGSQFFLVYKNSTLAPSYTPFGTIVSGLNIIQNVAKAGSDNSNGTGDGHPKEKVEIESVTIKKT